jgi:hypothetical protein
MGDTALAVLGATLTVMTYGFGVALGNQHPERVAILGLVAFGLPAGSAVYGYSQVSSCRDAQGAAALRRSRPGPPGSS